MPKILVVDDDVSILEVVELLLEQAGYDVVTTPNGEETFDKIADHKPDLLLLDVLLSGEDGRHICQQAKSQADTTRLPIIMISAHPDAGVTTIQAGADDFLAKPFNIEELLAKIEQNIEHKS